jgi:hypothetical protein
MINKLLENIEYSRAEKIIYYYEFRNILEDKWNKVLDEVKNKKRLTENNRDKLMEIFEEDLFISFAPAWGGHQPQYLTNYIHGGNDLINSITNRHDIHINYDLYNWHKELMETKIFEIIDNQWTKNDTDYLSLICNNFSNSIEAASYFFSQIYKLDNRYEILFNYYHKENLNNEKYKMLNENVYEQIIKGHTESDVNIKFLHNYLEIKRLELNIPIGLAIKKCKFSNIYYVEHFHIAKYSYNHLYLPYCETVSGWYPYYSKSNNIYNQVFEKEALEYLKIFCNIIEGIPSVNDWNIPIYSPDNVKDLHDVWIKSPNSDYFKNMYGDFRAALIKAELIPESAINSKFGVMCISKDGHFCRSMAEQKIDNWLFNNNIPHETEPIYPKHEIFNKNGRLRADWKIGDNFVEYFGLPEDKKYAEKMEKKRNLANALNIELIELFYEDILNLDEVLVEMKVKYGA